MTKRVYPSYIRQFLTSSVMSKYLEYKELSAWQITSLIYYATASIHMKHTALNKLHDLAVRESDKELIQYSCISIRNIEDALSETSGNAIYTLEEGSHNLSSKETVLSLQQVFTTYGSAKTYIEHFCLDEPKEKYWYEIVKWNNTPDGKCEPICSYLLVNRELWFIELNSDYYDDPCIRMDLYDMRNINLPVPFTPGDIIKSNGSPFGYSMLSVIVDVGDNSDCCSLQGIARNSDNTWSMGAVKHSMIGYDYSPRISPLYSVELCILPSCDDILNKVSAFISADHSNSRILYEYSLFRDHMSDEELLSICNK